MADPDHPPSPLPTPSPEERRVAAARFEQGNLAVARGDHDAGIRLFLDCCLLDPANLLYRQALRRTEKARWRNNLRGGWFSWLTAWPARARQRRALRRRDHLAVLAHGEQVLLRNPWNAGAQVDMAEAAEAVGLVDLAVWLLEQARQKKPRDLAANRKLARLYESRGNFTQARSLWELIARDRSDDPEAGRALRVRPEGAQERSPVEEVARDSVAEGPPPSGGALDRPQGAEPAAEAGEALRARIEADPTSPGPYLDLARLYRAEGRLEEAHAVLRRGLGPTGNAFLLASELADLEIEPFRQDLRIAEARVREAPGDGLAAELRDRLRREVNARELDLFRQKADRYPTDLACRLELGRRLLEAGRLDEAVAELEAAGEDPGTRPQAQELLNACARRRNGQARVRLS